MRAFRTTTFGLAAATVALTMTVAGCGSSSSNKAKTTGTNAPTTAAPNGSTPGSDSASATSSTVAAANAATDLATARAAVLTTADMPGYDAKPYQPSGDLPAAAKKQFAQCLGVSQSMFDDTPGAQKAHSDDFSKGDTNTVSAEIEIDPQQSDINKGWDQLNKSGVENCLSQLFSAAIKDSVGSEAGVTVGDATVTRLPFDAGDRATGFTLKVPISGKGQSFTFYVDIVYAQHGRAGITLMTLNLASPYDHAFEKSLVDKMVQRLGDKTS